MFNNIYKYLTKNKKYVIIFTIILTILTLSLLVYRYYNKNKIENFDTTPNHYLFLVSVNKNSLPQFILDKINENNMSLQITDTDGNKILLNKVLSTYLNNNMYMTVGEYIIASINRILLNDNQINLLKTYMVSNKDYNDIIEVIKNSLGINDIQSVKLLNTYNFYYNNPSNTTTTTTTTPNITNSTKPTITSYTDIENNIIFGPIDIKDNNEPTNIVNSTNDSDGDNIEAIDNLNNIKNIDRDSINIPVIIETSSTLSDESKEYMIELLENYYISINSVLFTDNTTTIDGTKNIYKGLLNLYKLYPKPIVNFNSDTIFTNKLEIHENIITYFNNEYILPGSRNTEIYRASPFMNPNKKITRLYYLNTNNVTTYFIKMLNYIFIYYILLNNLNVTTQIKNINSLLYNYCYDAEIIESYNETYDMIIESIISDVKIINDSLETKKIYMSELNLYNITKSIVNTSLQFDQNNLNNYEITIIKNILKKETQIKIMYNQLYLKLYSLISEKILSNKNYKTYNIIDNIYIYTYNLTFFIKQKIFNMTVNELENIKKTDNSLNTDITDNDNDVNIIYSNIINDLIDKNSTIYIEKTNNYNDNLMNIMSIIMDIDEYNLVFNEYIYNAKNSTSNSTKLNETLSKLDLDSIDTSFKRLSNTEINEYILNINELNLQEIEYAIYKPNPTQSEPTQSEPTQSELTQSELTQSELTQSEPTQSEPTQSEPSQSGQNQSGQNQSEPTQSGENKSGQNQSESRKNNDYNNYDEYYSSLGEAIYKNYRFGNFFPFDENSNDNYMLDIVGNNIYSDGTIGNNIFRNNEKNIKTLIRKELDTVKTNDNTYDIPNSSNKESNFNGILNVFKPVINY